MRVSEFKSLCEGPSGAAIIEAVKKGQVSITDDSGNAVEMVFASAPAPTGFDPESVKALSAQITSDAYTRTKGVRPPNVLGDPGLYAMPHGGTKLSKHFASDAAATRFGRFALAIRGHERSQKWLGEQGIVLKSGSLEGVNSAGGYLVPDELQNDLIQLRELYGVFRRYSHNVRMSSDTCTRPRRVGGLSAVFVAEAQAGTASTKTWDAVSLVAKKAMILTKVSNELGEDAIINIADDLADEIVRAFAYLEDNCGFNGDASALYSGITGVCPKLQAAAGNPTTTSAGGVVVGTGNAYTELTLADFHQVVAVLPEYADTPQCAWYCSRVFWANTMERLARAAAAAPRRRRFAGRRLRRSLGIRFGFPRLCRRRRRTARFVRCSAIWAWLPCSATGAKWPSRPASAARSMAPKFSAAINWPCVVPSGSTLWSMMSGTAPRPGRLSAFNF